MKTKQPEALPLAPEQPVAIVTDYPVMGVKFTEAFNYGCDLPAGTKLYARVAPAAQPDDAIIRAWQAGYYHAGYTNDQAYADKMAREYAGATPAPQAQQEPVRLPGIAKRSVEKLEHILGYAESNLGVWSVRDARSALDNLVWLIGRKAEHPADTAAPAAQLDTRKVIEQMVEALEFIRRWGEPAQGVEKRDAALQAGQKLLKELG